MKDNIWRGPDGKDHKVSLDITKGGDVFAGRIRLLIDGWCIVNISPEGRLERIGGVSSATGLKLNEEGRIKRAHRGSTQR